MIRLKGAGKNRLNGFQKKFRNEELARYQRDALLNSDDPVEHGHSAKVGFRERPDLFSEEKNKRKLPEHEFLTKHKNESEKLKRQKLVTDAIQSETKYESRPLVELSAKDKFPEMPEELANLCGQHPFRTMYCGFSGSGKTTKLVYDIQVIYSKFYKPGNIHVFSPNIDIDPTWKDAIHIKGYDTMKWDIVEKLRDENRKRAKEGGRSATIPYLVIIDDFAADPEVVRNQKIRDMAVRLRHDGISLIILTQVFKLLHTTFRRNLTDMHLWDPNNREELDAIAESCTPTFLRATEFATLLQHATFEKHSYLTIHFRNPEYSRYWKNNVEPINLIDYIYKRPTDKSMGQEALMKMFDEKFKEFAYEKPTCAAEGMCAPMAPPEEAKDDSTLQEPNNTAKRPISEISDKNPEDHSIGKKRVRFA